MKKVLILLIYIVLVLFILGCSPESLGQNTSNSSNNSTDPINANNSTILGSEAEGPLSMLMTFANGAPKLNQTAELNCLISIRIQNFGDITLTIILPDGIQLTSGSLVTDLGRFDGGKYASMGTTREVTVSIKPVNTGNYTITAKLHSTDFAGKPKYCNPCYEEVFLSVSENSSVWDTWLRPWWEPQPPVPQPNPTPIPHRN